MTRTVPPPFLSSRSPLVDATARPSLAHNGQLRRSHLDLQRHCELLRPVEPQPEVGQACLLATDDLLRCEGL